MNNDERRRVAYALRAIPKKSVPSDLDCRIAEALNGEGFCKEPECSKCFEASCNRLADLIEPEPERTCRDVGNNDKFVCSECSASLDYEGRWDEPTYWVDDVAAVVEYCPSCGARVVYDD